MKVYEWQTLDTTNRKNLLSRPPMSQDEVVKQQAISIIEQVCQQGDNALFQFSQQFDHVSLERLSIDCRQPQSVSSSAQAALETAIQTISDYHLALKPEPVTVKTSEGITLTRQYRPIQRVGLYVPGGETPLISSLLMLAIPANIAGNPVKVACSPPNRFGDINPLLKEAARLCGIDRIYAIGGAQAIAAMAYGTSTVPKVDKLFGPGNRFVTAAKSLVCQDANGASIDMPAGPSELMILADRTANPAFVAADLLSQAEHGPDSQVMLVTTDSNLVQSVLTELNRQKQSLPRGDIINQALSMSRIIIVSSKQDMVDIANDYAAEHLIINTKNAASLADDINAAGTIFLGPWAAESMGDYITGSNHVLPTYGFARSISGLTTNDFMNAVSIQKVSADAILTIGKHARFLAAREGLLAHDNAIAVREAYLCQSNS